MLLLGTNLLHPAPSAAHPLSQGALDVIVSESAITVRAQVTREEVAVTHTATDADPLPGPWAASASDAFDAHAAYLAAHLHFRADGVALAGRVVSVAPPVDAPGVATAMASYELAYPLPSARPRLIELRQDVLADGRFPAGTSWDATYVVKIAQGANAQEGLLLTRGQAINFLCDWTARPAPAAGAASATVDRRGLFGAYFRHGVIHILTGYDHLLFVSALVLAATSLWDLVKVVSAFTLAHTITLTLAALDVVHLSERISEPLISLSIVFVAVQNVFWPRQSRGWVRLGAAFFFGLFHGLGFAGGLLDAMREMHGTTVLLAIVAFSIGVEIGHQVVVLPLFATLQIARATRPDERQRNQLSLAAQQFGSAAISLAGLWFLVIALRESFIG